MPDGVTFGTVRVSIFRAGEEGVFHFIQLIESSCGIGGSAIGLVRIAESCSP